MQITEEKTEVRAEADPSEEKNNDSSPLAETEPADADGQNGSARPGTALNISPALLLFVFVMPVVGFFAFGFVFVFLFIAVVAYALSADGAALMNNAFIAKLVGALPAWAVDWIGSIPKGVLYAVPIVFIICSFFLLGTVVLVLLLFRKRKTERQAEEEQPDEQQ